MKTVFLLYFLQWTFYGKNKNWIVFHSAQWILLDPCRAVCNVILREKMKKETVLFILFSVNVPLSRTHLGGVGNWVGLSAELICISPSYLSWNLEKKTQLFSWIWKVISPVSLILQKCNTPHWNENFIVYPVNIIRYL